MPEIEQIERKKMAKFFEEKRKKREINKKLKEDINLDPTKTPEKINPLKNLLKIKNANFNQKNKYSPTKLFNSKFEIIPLDKNSYSVDDQLIQLKDLQNVIANQQKDKLLRDGTLIDRMFYSDNEHDFDSQINSKKDKISKLDLEKLNTLNKINSFGQPTIYEKQQHPIASNENLEVENLLRNKLNKNLISNRILKKDKKKKTGIQKIQSKDGKDQNFKLPDMKIVFTKNFMETFFDTKPLSKTLFILEPERVDGQQMLKLSDYSLISIKNLVDSIIIE